MFNYDFPLIECIDDVLPAIEGRPEFVVTVKDGYTVINYNVAFDDTFPPINVAGGSAKMRSERSRHNAIRRECRGIIFDNETGKILRRPYHKFFNVNERDETQDHKIDLSYRNSILEKLDGSMIAPFKVQGNMIWGTKMGATDVAKPVEEFIKNNPHYVEFATEMLSYGFTPIFEWCSRKQRIVLDYDEDHLILTALRFMVSGCYHIESVMQYHAGRHNIPVVRSFDPQTDMKSFVQYVHDLEDVEGFVVRFDSGHMVKLKCHWYIQIHKAKEAILQDRNIVAAIFENKLDDIKAHLPEADRIRLENFEHHVMQAVINLSKELYNRTSYYVESLKIDRKTFALECAHKETSYGKSIIFSLWDDNSEQRAYDMVVKTLLNNLGKTAKYDEIRDAWFPGIHYN